MTKNLITVRKETTIRELRDLFEQYDFNLLPVVHDEKLVGVITKLDLMKTFTTGGSVSKTDFLRLFAERAEDIMRRAIVSIHPEDELKKAVEYMVEFKLRSLPVVEDDKLVGIISRKDLMRHLFVDEKS